MEPDDATASDPWVPRVGPGVARARIERRPTAVFVAAVVAVMLLVAGCAPTPDSLGRDAQVAQLVAFVEARRGHRFTTPPTVTFVPDDEFRSHVLAAVDSAEPELDVDEVAFKALGWMAPDADLFDAYRTVFGGAVVGFYDPDTKVLEVRGNRMTAYRREVVVHELTHALDDQLFDLGASRGPGVLSEQQLAYLVAVEGDAAWVQNAYVKQASPAERLDSLTEQLGFPVDAAMLSVPVALLSLSQTPYLRGPEFVSQVRSRVPVDDVFARFPATAEQAWNVEKYLAAEPAEPVAVPPADGTVVATGSWGQFLMSLILADGVNLDGRINHVTDGWAGDSFVTWTEGSRSCIRIDTRTDDAPTADRLGAALERWASRSGAAIERLEPDEVRLTRCA